MIRLLVVTPLLLGALLLGGLYAAYGEADPCRAYAVERARRSEAALGFHSGGAIERWTRLETSQISTGECALGLAHSWQERLGWR